VARVPSIRASDSDRDEVAERLRLATVEGRLNADELEGRLERLHASRTYGELDALVADLPASSPPRRAHVGITPRVGIRRWVGAAGAVTLLLVALGVLATEGRRSVAAFPRPRQPGQFVVSAPLVESHRLIVVAASMVAVLVLVAVFAMLLWLTRARNISDA
jgi:hypothetical protein